MSGKLDYNVIAAATISAAFRQEVLAKGLYSTVRFYSEE
jgi:hypothetical protein